MIRGINYLNTSDSLRIEFSEFFEDYDLDVQHNNVVFNFIAL